VVLERTGQETDRGLDVPLPIQLLFYLWTIGPTCYLASPHTCLPAPWLSTVIVLWLSEHIVFSVALTLIRLYVCSHCCVLYGVAVYLPLRTFDALKHVPVVRGDMLQL